jgi:D-alanyl-D-alanine carboxypeptidase
MGKANSHHTIMSRHNDLKTIMYFQKQIIKVTLLAAFFLSCTISAAQIIRPERLDSLFDHLEQYNQSVGNISIFKDGKEVYNRSFGQRHIAGLSFDEHTSYQVGSVTKLATSVLLWKMVEQGKVSLDERLSTYFPDIPNAHMITLNQILSHNSGLGNYVNNGTTEGWMIEKTSADSILAFIHSEKPLFEPGTGFQYSNSGFYLLTRIVEKLYNKTYGQLIEEEIAKPLELTDFKSFDNYNDNRFTSYVYIRNWEDMTDFYFQNIIGVGDIVATPRDLNRFMEGLFAGKLVKKETLEKMKGDKANNGFGKGFMYIPYKGNTFLGHGGDTRGTHTLTGYNDKDKITFSIAINGQRWERNQVYIASLSTIYETELRLAEFETNVIKLSSQQLSQYEGRYFNEDDPLIINIFQHEGELFGQADGQDAFPLTCYSKDKFMFDGAQIYMDFTPAQDSMYYKQGSVKINFKRQKTEAGQ